MQTVLTAFQVLEEVARRQPIGVTELARHVGKPKSTTQRFLRSLEDAGWVRAVGTVSTQWVLTARAMIVAGAVGGETGIRELARPVMERLRDSTGEATHLAVPDRSSIVILDRLEALHAVRVYDAAGQHGPSHSTANGKALLAFGSPSMVATLLPEELVAVTDRTITEREVLEAELCEVRRRGWARAIGESGPDVASVAAPILSQFNRPIASMSVYFPLHRLPADDGEHYGELVRDAAREVSRLLVDRVDRQDAQH